MRGAAGPARAAGERAPADDGQWVMPAKNYASTRFRELTEITPQNAAALQVSFSFPTGTTRGNEAAPLVVGGTMYVLPPTPTRSTRWT